MIVIEKLTARSLSLYLAAAPLLLIVAFLVKQKRKRGKEDRWGVACVVGMMNIEIPMTIFDYKTQSINQH